MALHWFVHLPRQLRMLCDVRFRTLIPFLKPALIKRDDFCSAKHKSEHANAFQRNNEHITRIIVFNNNINLGICVLA